MNKAEYRRVGGIGPGGYKCDCCGPKPKARPVFRRLVRHIMKNADRIEFKKVA